MDNNTSFLIPTKTFTFRYILDKHPAFYRNSGFAFITEKNFRLYLKHLETTYPNKKRFSVILKRIIIGRKLRIQFYSLLAVVLSIGLAVFCCIQGHYTWSFILGISFFVGLKLAIYSIALGDSKAFDIIYQLQAKTESQNTGRISTKIGDHLFEFTQQEVLIIEYFQFKAQEGKTRISFGRNTHSVNKELIAKKLKGKWGVVKIRTLNNLLVRNNNQFKFLKVDKTKNANQKKLDNIYAYFTAAELFEAQELFEEEFFS